MRPLLKLSVVFCMLAFLGVFCWGAPALKNENNYGVKNFSKRMAESGAEESQEDTETSQEDSPEQSDSNQEETQEESGQEDSESQEEPESTQDDGSEQSEGNQSQNQEESESAQDESSDSNQEDTQQEESQNQEESESAQDESSDSNQENTQEESEATQEDSQNQEESESAQDESSDSNQEDTQQEESQNQEESESAQDESSDSNQENTQEESEATQEDSQNQEESESAQEDSSESNQEDTQQEDSESQEEPESTQDDGSEQSEDNQENTQEESESTQEDSQNQEESESAQDESSEQSNSNQEESEESQEESEDSESTQESQENDSEQTNSNREELEPTTTQEPTTPEAKTPEATTPEPTTPETASPEATPEATTLEATTPESTTPETATREVTTPEATTPESTTTTSSHLLCPSISHPVLPEARVGTTITTKCISGLFEGNWTCTAANNSLVPEWHQDHCEMPSALNFISTPDMLVAEQGKVIDGVATLLRADGLNSYSLASEVITVMTETMSSVSTIGLKETFITGILETYGKLLLSLQSLPEDESDSLVKEILYQLDIFASKLPHNGYFETDLLKLNLYTLTPNSERITGIAADRHSITLPGAELLQSLQLSEARAASYCFNSSISTYFTSDVISPVISTTLFCGEKLCNTSHANLENPVQVTFHHIHIPEKERAALCSFLELPGSESWEQRGCSLNSRLSNSTVSVCECDHLTHFAILLSPGTNFSATHQLALRSIGYIGISISALGMIATILVLSCMKSLWGIRNFVHVNLCATLMAAQLLFVVAVDKTGNKILCSVIAVVLEYLFLSSFMWMLMEGVVLYVLLVVVFVQGRERQYIILFTILSYGAPAVYMALVTPLGYLIGDTWSFGTESYCWLSYADNFIWTFIIPVVIIILINIGFFIMTFKVMVAQDRKKKNKTSARWWLKSAISLTVIMGITWIVGLLIFHDYLIAVAYIFTIFAAFQGLGIFILFIILSKSIREAILVFIGEKTNQSEFIKRHLGSVMPLERTSKGTEAKRRANIEFYKQLQKKRSEASFGSNVIRSTTTLKLEDLEVVCNPNSVSSSEVNMMASSYHQMSEAKSCASSLKSNDSAVFCNSHSLTSSEMELMDA